MTFSTGAGQTAGSGSAKLDRQDQLEIFCQKEMVRVFFVQTPWNLSALDSCLKSHYSPARAHPDGILELISGKLNHVFQTILGAIATGTCRMHLDYL